MSSELSLDFGKRLRRLRQYSRLTEAEAARRSGLEADDWPGLESDPEVPSPERMGRVAAGLNVPAELLCDPPESLWLRWIGPDVRPRRFLQDLNVMVRQSGFSTRRAACLYFLNKAAGYGGKEIPEAGFRLLADLLLEHADSQRRGGDTQQPGPP